MPGSFYEDQPSRNPLSERLLEALSRLPFTVVAGSVLGAAEGVILAFPLAAILGRFRIAG